MSDYTKITDFSGKDDLPSGNANKVGSAEEIDDEFNAIETAIATKLDEVYNVTQDSTTARTLVDGDVKRRFISFTNGAAVTITLNTAVGAPGDEFRVRQASTGTLSFAGSATILGVNTTTTQEDVITLMKLNATTWIGF